MKTKRPSGFHVTKRKTIQFTREWWTVIAATASKRRQPVIWLLMDCIAKAADKEGLKRPELPWEKEVKE